MLLNALQSYHFFPKEHAGFVLASSLTKDLISEFFSLMYAVYVVDVKEIETP
jgi:hypothetical protein